MPRLGKAVAMDIIDRLIIAVKHQAFPAGRRNTYLHGIRSDIALRDIGNQFQPVGKGNMITF